MTRIIRGALAAACVSLPLGACFTTNPSTQAAVEAILSNPANTSAGQIYAAVATLDPTFAAKVQGVASQASAYAQIGCGVLPAVSSIGAIAAAAYGAQGIYLTASQLAETFCTPYRTAAASSKVSAKRLVRAAAPNKAGATVSRPVEVYGIVVPAEGTVTNPSLVK